MMVAIQKTAEKFNFFSVVPENLYFKLKCHTLMYEHVPQSIDEITGEIFQEICGET